MNNYIQLYRNGQLLLPHCFNASSWWRRARGLIGRPAGVATNGLLLSPCNGVHNLFMSYAIDVIFLDREGTILKIVRDFTPWSPYAGTFKAANTLELLAGQADELGLEVGQQLTISPLPDGPAQVIQQDGHRPQTEQQTEDN